MSFRNVSTLSLVLIAILCALGTMASSVLSNASHVPYLATVEVAGASEHTRSLDRNEDHDGGLRHNAADHTHDAPALFPVNLSKPERPVAAWTPGLEVSTAADITRYFDRPPRLVPAV